MMKIYRSFIVFLLISLTVLHFTCARTTTTLNSYEDCIAQNADVLVKGGDNLIPHYNIILIAADPMLSKFNIEHHNANGTATQLGFFNISDIKIHELTFNNPTSAYNQSTHVFTLDVKNITLRGQADFQYELEPFPIINGGGLAHAELFDTDLHLTLTALNRTQAKCVDMWGPKVSCIHNSNDTNDDSDSDQEEDFSVNVIELNKVYYLVDVKLNLNKLNIWTSKTFWSWLYNIFLSTFNGKIKHAVTEVVQSQLKRVLEELLNRQIQFKIELHQKMQEAVRNLMRGSGSDSSNINDGGIITRNRHHHHNNNDHSNKPTPSSTTRHENVSTSRGGSLHHHPSHNDPTVWGAPITNRNNRRGNRSSPFDRLNDFFADHNAGANRDNV